MKKRVVSEDKQLIDDRDLNMTFVNPLLRVMACGFRIISEDEFTENQFNKNYNWETNLRFLGLLGIRDNIQKNVKETVQFLRQKNISVSILTGDRAITSRNW